MSASDFKAAKNGDNDYFRENSVRKDSWMLANYPKSGDTVLHFAARHDHCGLLEYFVSAGANLETANLDGKRPLHEAAQSSSRECVKFLLGCGVKIDSLKRADWTPLMLACTKEDIQTVQTLFEAGADPSLCNKDGWNAFHIAVREGHLAIIEYLLHHNKGLWRTVSKNLRTPLHTAALHGLHEVTQFLLDHCNYGIDERDSCGSTPLMDALRVNSPLTASILISKHKANVRSEDNLGRQALHLAAQSGATDSVRYLVTDCRVSPDTVCEGSQLTALHYAAKEGQVEVIRQLLSLRASVNPCDNKGRTALHIASGAQHAACVATLLQHGAGCQPDLSGTLPQQLARKPEVMAVFQQHGVT